VGVLFYLRSDGQYILLGDTIMAVFLLIIILCDVLIDSGRSSLLKVIWTICSIQFIYHLVCLIIFLTQTLVR
jgi:hypothetical protein